MGLGNNPAGGAGAQASKPAWQRFLGGAVSGIGATNGSAPSASASMAANIVKRLRDKPAPPAVTPYAGAAHESMHAL